MRLAGNSVVMALEIGVYIAFLRGIMVMLLFMVWSSKVGLPVPLRRISLLEMGVRTLNLEVVAPRLLELFTR